MLNAYSSTECLLRTCAHRLQTITNVVWGWPFPSTVMLLLLLLNNICQSTHSAPALAAVLPIFPARTYACMCMLHMQHTSHHCVCAALLSACMYLS